MFLLSIAAWPNAAGIAAQHVIAKAVVRAVPAENAAVPLPSPFAADGPVEADVGGKVPAVGGGAIAPGVDVFEHPALVLGFVRQQVRLRRERRREQVQRMIAADVRRAC